MMMGPLNSSRMSKTLQKLSASQAKRSSCTAGENTAMILSTQVRVNVLFYARSTNEGKSLLRLSDRFAMKYTPFMSLTTE
jgi:hypothetical protein